MIFCCGPWSPFLGPPHQMEWHHKGKSWQQNFPSTAPQERWVLQTHSNAKSAMCAQYLAFRGFTWSMSSPNCWLHCERYCSSDASVSSSDEGSQGHSMTLCFFCNVQDFNRHKMIKNVTNSLSRLMWLLLIIYLCGSSAWAPFFVGWKWQDETWPDGSNPLSSYPAKFVHTTHCHIMALPHLPSAGADDGKNIKSESQFFEQVRYRA